MYVVNYHAAIGKVLSPAYGDDTQFIESEIAAGICTVFRAANAPLYLVIRYEGSEMVVVAAAGKQLAKATQEIIEHAKAKGMQSIRFHTIDPHRLEKGVKGLPIELAEHRPNASASDEFVFRMRL